MSVSIKSKLSLYNTGKPQESRTQEDPVTEISPQGFTVKDTVIRNPAFGSCRLSDFLPFSLSPILEISYIPDSFPLHPHDVLFFDTETTGLSRGAGNLPFLLGFSWIDKTDINIKQYFLKDPSAESEMLESVTEFMGRFGILATFNGKSFDVPLLKNRLILNRRKAGEPLMHFDLLHIYRRLLPRDHWKGHSQSAVEEAVLGFRRENDISGAQVPQIYFDFLRYGEDSGISKIIHHNELDVTGLVFLFLKAAALYREKNPSLHALRSGIARILIRNHRFPEAADLLQNPVNYKDHLFLAYALKKAGNFEEAAEVYSRIFAEFKCPFSLNQILKILEHRLGRPGEALSLLNENRQILEDYESAEKFMSRYKRLNKKTVSL